MLSKHHIKLIRLFARFIDLPMLLNWLMTLDFLVKFSTCLFLTPELHPIINNTSSSSTSLARLVVSSLSFSYWKSFAKCSTFQKLKHLTDLQSFAKWLYFPHLIHLTHELLDRPPLYDLRPRPFQISWPECSFTSCPPLPLPLEPLPIPPWYQPLPWVFWTFPFIVSFACSAWLRDSSFFFLLCCSCAFCDSVSYSHLEYWQVLRLFNYANNVLKVVR